MLLFFLSGIHRQFQITHDHVTMHVITFKTSFLLTIQLDHTLHKSLQLNERKEKNDLKHREDWDMNNNRLK